jgi:hypothetical protein
MPFLFFIAENAEGEYGCLFLRFAIRNSKLQDDSFRGVIHRFGGRDRKSQPLSSRTSSVSVIGLPAGHEHEREEKPIGYSPKLPRSHVFSQG